MSPRILLATRSEGKMRELRPLALAVGLDVVSLGTLQVPESAEERALEQFETFEENALAKAHYFLARTGLPTIADDSGLCVHALEDRPGVRSKRFSGRDDLDGLARDAANSAALVAALAGVVDRRAAYRCAAAYADWRWATVVEGRCTGRILGAPRGTGGFGYDPWFLSDDLGHTFAEASIEAKEAVSHRGRAMRGLFDALGQRNAGR